MLGCIGGVVEANAADLPAGSSVGGSGTHGDGTTPCDEPECSECPIVDAAALTQEEVAVPFSFVKKQPRRRALEGGQEGGPAAVPAPPCASSSLARLQEYLDI